MNKDNPTQQRKEYSDNPKYTQPIPHDNEKGFPLLHQSNPYYSFDDLIISDEVKERLHHVVLENKNASKLYAIGLRPKQKILFCGPPGTGKTLAAKVMSNAMGYPFIHVLFDAIISSFLGETATNLRKIFNHIEAERYVVLFDEFDIVAKKRDDPHEHGEVKRVVNNFMQMLDHYDGDSILIAATNHQHLLDAAVWRRFDEILYFDLPDNNYRRKLFQKYLLSLKKSEDIDLSYCVRKTRGYSAADIAQICEDAMRKSTISDRNEINTSDVMWALSEQQRRKKTIAQI